MPNASPAVSALIDREFAGALHAACLDLARALSARCAAGDADAIAFRRCFVGIVRHCERRFGWPPAAIES